MLSPTSPVAIKPSLRRGDGLPFAGEQGQRQVKIYDMRNEVIKIRDMRKKPIEASGAAATIVVVIPEVPDKKKRKRGRRAKGPALMLATIKVQRGC